MAATTELCNWLVIVLLCVISNTRRYYCVNGEAQVPCLFIFGDSLVDSGNNNKLDTKAKANYLPYGIDFPHGPTGRFTNGRTVADMLGEILGFEHFIKPFSTVKGLEILKGVNYASGYAGILDETGQHMGARIALNKQLKHHQIILSRMAHILGNNQSAAKHHLHKCLYLSVIGNNDYINNYFLPHLYNRSRHYSPKKFAEVLIKKYALYLKKLHSYGARKVAVFGLSAIGCTPNATAYYGTNGSLCVDKINKAASLFNHRLRFLVHQLNKNLTGARFIYLDGFNFPLLYATSHGAGINITACCPVDKYGLCGDSKTPCSYRNVALFWDSLHPTQFLNLIIAILSYIQLKSSGII